MEAENALNFLLEKTNECDNCIFVNYCNKLCRETGIIICELFEDLIKEANKDISKENNNRNYF